MSCMAGDHTGLWVSLVRYAEHTAARMYVCVLVTPPFYPYRYRLWNTVPELPSEPPAESINRLLASVVINKSGVRKAADPLTWKAQIGRRA